MNIELRLVEDGVEQGILPDCQKIDVSPVVNDYGSVSFDYPKDGINWSLLKGKDEFEVAVYLDGIHHPELDAIVKDISGDDIADASIYSYAGNMMLTVLDEGRVYPNGWPAYDPAEPNHKLSGYTAGQYMARFISQAQARGSLQGVTYDSFTATVDSNGVPWTNMISLEIKPGPRITEVLQSLYANGLCEFRMVGRDLKLYNPDTLSVDRTLSSPPLTFRKGRDLRDSPRKISSREVATVFLGAGKEDVGAYVEDIDATAVANRRRIEGYVSNGNITDNGTLHAFTQLQLKTFVDAKMEKTSGLEFVDPDSPRPIDDFDIGDWGYIEVDGTLERLRIKQWVLSKDSAGRISGSVTMNDVFAEAAENLSKRIDGILGGTTVSGESRAVPVVPEDVYDDIAPATPALPNLATSTYTDKNGHTFAQVTVSWIAVTQNTDGTPLADLAGYRIAWQVPSLGVDVHYVDTGNVTVAAFSPVAPDVAVQVTIQAFDKYGNASAWSPVATITSGKDTIAPETPGGLTMDNYAGLGRLTWNGATASGANWALDFSYAEVHFSTVNNFTPTYGSGGTLSDSLTGAGKSFAKGTYNQPLYARMVAVDTSGNKSAPSAVVSATPQQILSADIFDGAVGTAKLADLAVTTAKIANLAVNSAQIGSVNAGSILAGVINADLTVGARIATALTGKRMELNAIGLQGWDASGNNTVSIDGLNNLLMGTLRTALTGRRIEILASGNNGEINFWGSAGELAQVRGFTADPLDWSSSAIGLRVPITGTNATWNQIAINTAEDMYFSSGSANFLLGAGSAGNQGFQIRWLSNKVLSGGINGTGTARFVVNDLNTLVYGPTGHLGFYVTNTSGQQDLWTRTQVYSTANNFGGAMDVTYWRSDCSPAVRLLQSNMASGGVIFFDTTSSWFSFATANGSAFETIRVAAVDTTSDESAKKSIRKFSGGARAKVSGMEPHTYQMRGKGVNQRRRLGFMSHTAPDEVRIIPHRDDPIQHEAIDLYGLTTLGIQYSKEIDSDLEAGLASLRAEIAELREELANR